MLTVLNGISLGCGKGASHAEWTGEIRQRPQLLIPSIRQLMRFLSSAGQPVPFPPREPTYAQLRAQIAVYRAEFEVVRNTPAAILIAAMRKIVTQADEGCRDSGNPQRDAERLAALFNIRHVALDALFAVRVSERGPNAIAATK